MHPWGSSAQLGGVRGGARQVSGWPGACSTGQWAFLTNADSLLSARGRSTTLLETIPRTSCAMRIGSGGSKGDHLEVPPALDHLKDTEIRIHVFFSQVFSRIVFPFQFPVLTRGIGFYRKDLKGLVKFPEKSRAKDGREATPPVALGRGSGGACQ
jgi:hypothetical protein